MQIRILIIVSVLLLFAGTAYYKNKTASLKATLEAERIERRKENSANLRTILQLEKYLAEERKATELMEQEVFEAKQSYTAVVNQMKALKANKDEKDCLNSKIPAEIIAIIKGD